MSRTTRGKRTGTGPYKDSYRAKQRLKGRRKSKGVRCPQS